MTIHQTKLPPLPAKPPSYMELAHAFNNACDDIVWIRSDKTSDDAGTYAIWSQGQWKQHTPQDIFREMQRLAAKALPEVARPDPIVRQALSMLHAHMPATCEMDWDRSLEAIPFADGNKSLCLQTGAIIPTEKHHRMLRRMNVHSGELGDQAAYEASNFKKFLESWLPDNDRRSFVQQALANGLLGNPTSTIMDCWGTGRNGKGALFEYLKQAIGEYCTTLDTCYYSNGKSKHEWEKLRLKYARFAIIGEFEPGEAVDTGKLKSEAGGDTFSPSGKGKDGLEIFAQCLFIIHGNAKLTMRDMSKGIHDRWKLLKFVRYFSDKERMGRPKMASIAKSERGVFLYWLIQGIRQFVANECRYVNIGTVVADTAEYFESENVVMQIIRKYCIPMEHAKFKMSDFYNLTISDDDARWKSSKGMTKAFEQAGMDITREVMGRYPTLRGYMHRKEARDAKIIAEFESEDILGKLEENGEVTLFETPDTDSGNPDNSPWSDKAKEVIAKQEAEAEETSNAPDAPTEVSSIIDNAYAEMGKKRPKASTKSTGDRNNAMADYSRELAGGLK